MGSAVLPSRVAPGEARVQAPAPSMAAPAPGEVHLWFASLDDPAALQGAVAALSIDELARAARFRFERDRRRFVAGRALLRRLLGSYLDRPAADIRFAYGPQGKPRLAGPDSGRGLVFNVSHSGGAAVLGFSAGCGLGVDLERFPPPDDGDAVARHFFSPAEVRALDALGPAERPAAFLRCWTRKEAYVKARGDGLSLPLDSFDVSLAPGAPAALLAARGDARDASAWTLIDLSAHCPGHIAALAIDRGDLTLATAHL